MKDKENDDNDGNDGHKKKKKKQNQEESRLVQNSSKIEAWMAASRDDYQRYFAGKHLQLCPQLNGRPMCQRFHSKGHCFQTALTLPVISQALTFQVIPVPSTLRIAKNVKRIFRGARDNSTSIRSTVI